MTFHFLDNPSIFLIDMLSNFAVFESYCVEGDICCMLSLYTYYYLDDLPIWLGVSLQVADVTHSLQQPAGKKVWLILCCRAASICDF